MSRLIYHPLRAVNSLPSSVSVGVSALILAHFDGTCEQYVYTRDNISTVPGDLFDTFVGSLQGRLVSKISPSYDVARSESDPAFNKHPSFVVYCSDTTDVVNCINYCRANGIRVCSRAGGHSTAGFSVLDDSLVVDVSNIKGIFIDRDNMVSTVGSGVRWGEYNHALSVYGLHNPGGSCSDVGMTGYTLGGGYGYTSMKWGICCDNLLEVTVVTAHGQIVVANKDHNADLLWAHRGGTGGNFGIVVAMKYQLYNLNNVWKVVINWPIKDAATVLAYWQDNMTHSLQDTNLGLLGFLAFDKSEVPYFCIRGIYSGEISPNNVPELQNMLNIPGTNPVMQPPELVNYADANDRLLDDVEGVIPGNAKETKRSSYVEKLLSVEQYQAIVNKFVSAKCKFNIASMEPYGGAITSIPADGTAFVHRSAYFDIFVDSFWIEDDPSKKAEAFEWLKNFFEDADMKDIWSNHYYQNYPNIDYSDYEEGYFAQNYPALQKIKQRWDPDNMFHYDQSIRFPTGHKHKRGPSDVSTSPASGHKKHRSK